MSGFILRRSASFAVLLTMLCWSPVWGQESSLPRGQDQQEVEKEAKDASEIGPTHAFQEMESSSHLNAAALMPVDFRVPRLGSSRSGGDVVGAVRTLAQYDSPVRWRSAYVRAMEFVQAYDEIRINPGSSQNSLDNRNIHASVFRTHLVYDRQFPRGRLVLEYIPRMAIVNGRIDDKFSNQTFDLNSVRQLSDRWTFAVSTSAGHHSVSRVYGDYFLDISSVGATAIRSSFLEGQGSWTNAGVDGTFAYRVSPTTTVSMSPFFGYNHVSGEINAPQPFSIFQSGGKVSWNKQFSAFTNLSANYYSRVVHSLGSGILYQTAELGYSKQLGLSTQIEASIGFLTAGFATGRESSLSGSVGVSRKFGRSKATVTYYRGMPLFDELAYHSIVERVDARYERDLSERWYWQVMGAYEHSLSSGLSGSSASVSGRFVATDFGYRLTPQMSFYIGYGYKVQTGNDLVLLSGSGTRSNVIAGIRWNARPIQ